MMRATFSYWAACEDHNFVSDCCDDRTGRTWQEFEEENNQIKMKILSFFVNVFLYKFVFFNDVFN